MESPQTGRDQCDKNIEVMKVGMFLRKVKSRMWKRQRQRHYKLQEDCKTIAYKSSWAINSYSTFSISDVEAIREGHQSETLQGVANEFPADRCFTLVFRGRQGNLDLVADSAEEAQAWIQGLRALMENMENMDESTKINQWISDWFLKADKNKDGRINFKEAKTLLKMMNVDMNDEHASCLFKRADKSQSGTLEDEEFVEFYKMLTQRMEVLELFQEYSSNGQSLSQCDLEEFLREEQLEGEGSCEHALQLIEHYEPSDTARMNHSMSIDGFLMYLTSPEGSIFSPERQGVFQDMNQPLAHYYISSSHNTYLMEDQLKGPSSVEAYIQALKRGCRCVEVDCWNGANGEPVVYHGHTLTSKILLKDVISTVAQYAFKVSEYPLIVSIENHCNVEQQEVMARYFREMLGDMLLTSTADGRTSSELPSPEALKRKILLKGKTIGNESESLTGEVSDEDEAAEMNKDSPSSESAPTDSKILKQKLCKELSDLVFCKSVHFHSFEHSRTSSKPYEMSSLSETKTRKYSKEAGPDFVLHNTRQLTRIYPSGMRTDSSNYCPQDMWNIGCQIVALNFQTAGMEMDLNDGLFSQNGHCGYVLKPEILLNRERVFDPDKPQESENYHPLLFSVKVISGQQLPKLNKKGWSIVDPLVRVEIYGVPLDQAKQETGYIENNGFNPCWNETLQFKIHTPELALVRFVVEDYDLASRNDFIGQYTLPFTCIQPGYRHVHLLSKDGTSICPASLYVQIKITEL
ncbi:1-phosphatidylinositol 4,5-bisphosphate phosphodiesterase delta-4 isoform X2 [Myxocyprinus asiaticus]|uniref:1-phosphatidylinositol 4,5-bisphosphate phosphodiesterase delta-4 isoform X2 n=1 Tax=Myxocyprinus asiaticus TaxID=70543 RepID=UPI002223C36D|nr:1-phosphatidylinositol 4,5-bisphosphate phosphodiesterase delta-4 isoform X2 [Myxocyprinus asiaticus]